MIGNLQHLLNKKMNIRPMPRISFEIDGGLENAAKVEKALLCENINDDLRK
jgi:ribosome-binding factor A